MSNRGGAREGAGRKKQAVIRKLRTLKAFDDEWELIKIFERLVKKDRARAEELAKGL